jgi:hypothetical protein
MKYLRWLLIPAVLLLLTTSNAQPPPPFISAVFPAGGQRGKTVEVTVSGANLLDANAVRFTGAGVSASVTRAVGANAVRLSVTIAPDAELGERDLRLVTPGGASNRFRFFVSACTEVVEVEPNSEKNQAQQLPSLPVVVNGQAFEADRDFFRFSAKAGQTIVFEVYGRRIVPYIADAVPGWLESCLTLYDANGKELDYADDFRFRPDPALIHTFQKDGEYIIQINDVIYRGREDFVYRLTIGETPYVTHIFPLGSPRNTTTPVELHGVNLPTSSLNLTTPSDCPLVRPVSVSHNGFTSNALPFAASDLPETREVEPNDAVEKANKVQAPVTINGQIQQPGDVDYFQFSAAAGQSFTMEVQARRLDSPLDSIITLMNLQRGDLAENDDVLDPEQPLITHHADSRLTYTFRQKGDFVLRIRDVQGKGGDEYAYRLTIAPPQPDFALTVIPDNPRLGQGDTIMLTVNALRKDGFNGEINLSVQDLPAGFRTSEAMIQPFQNQGRLTITAPSDAPITMIFPTVIGTATIGSQTITRKATAAEAVMQAFSFTYNIPTKEFLMTIIPSDYFTLSVDLPPNQALEVKQDSEVSITVKAVRKPGGQGPIFVALAGAIPGITGRAAPIPSDKDEVAFALTVTNRVPIGSRQNIVIAGTMRVGRETVTRFTPAIPIKVVAAQK